MKSKTPAELGRRCEYLIRLVEQELSCQLGKPQASAMKNTKQTTLLSKKSSSDQTSKKKARQGKNENAGKKAKKYKYEKQSAQGSKKETSAETKSKSTQSSEKEVSKSGAVMAQRKLEFSSNQHAARKTHDSSQAETIINQQAERVVLEQKQDSVQKSNFIDKMKGF